MAHRRIHWNDYPGPYVQFSTMSTDAGKFIIRSSVMGDDAFFAIIQPFEGAGVGELFNFCWIEGGAGVGANTQPDATPPDFDLSKYAAPAALQSAVAAWNTWANNVWLKQTV